MKHQVQKNTSAQQPTVHDCPRCHHMTRFARAGSDGCWVCQKCLRVRLTLDVRSEQAQPERAASHA